ncbi:MAG: deoxyribose-phosphate aldolase [Vulcanisaeta sp.]|jgi:deoxyribose-phosphate aldolase|nr:deoxyribose-phosphate aldolase [Vulcanisaeta sp.]MCG2870471.1 deoxyribose-phosphate aldolase [Vulcanisaeta sp.]MCG2879895.1 deoxyribose-phosphate aldolase [Vulcanisaeta sp.]MCG2886733.1 deoxyribose-phosphate aldolase [Vulcanisaeta sp.]MCG2892588.1 deoxyribose-phosphate aldolase [Vulcanisaeta sp.]
MGLNIVGLIDNTYLKPYGSVREIEALIEDTARYGAYSITINPVFLRYAREYMARKGYRFRVVAVVDFPFGAGTTEVRVEAIRRYSRYADEFDVVAPIGLVKSGLWDEVESDINAVVEAAHREGKIVKIIVEDAYTTREEKLELYRIVMQSGADFIKTSTGFEERDYAEKIGNKTGAQIENVRLMAELSRRYNPRIGIKVAGGIRTYQQALELLRASEREPDPMQFRIGTSHMMSIIESMRGS